VSETYECVCIVCHRKFQSRREYARLCSGRCKSELGNLRRQGIAALVWAAQARADIPFADVAHTATLADLLAPEMEIDEGPTTAADATQCAQSACHP